MPQETYSFWQWLGKHVYVTTDSSATILYSCVRIGCCSNVFTEPLPGTEWLCRHGLCPTFRRNYSFHSHSICVRFLHGIAYQRDIQLLTHAFSSSTKISLTGFRYSLGEEMYVLSRILNCSSLCSLQLKLTSSLTVGQTWLTYIRKMIYDFWRTTFSCRITPFNNHVSSLTALNISSSRCIELNDTSTLCVYS